MHDYNIELFLNIINHLFMLRDCIHSGEIGTEPAIMGQYPIFQIGRIAGFKIDGYTYKPETFFMFSGGMPLCIRQASCMRGSAQNTSMVRYSYRTVPIIL